MKTCKDCTERYPGCHSTCGYYILQRRALDLRNEKIRAERDKERIGWKRHALIPWRLDMTRT